LWPNILLQINSETVNAQITLKGFRLHIKYMATYIDFMTKIFGGGGGKVLFFFGFLQIKSQLFHALLMSKCRQLQDLYTGMFRMTIPNGTILVMVHLGGAFMEEPAVVPPRAFPWRGKSKTRITITTLDLITLDNGNTTGQAKNGPKKPRYLHSIWPCTNTLQFQTFFLLILL